jgi:hypothetical protein
VTWFSGTSDGESLTIAGWDTEPEFTIGTTAPDLLSTGVPVSTMRKRAPSVSPSMRS